MLRLFPLMAALYNELKSSSPSCLVLINMILIYMGLILLASLLCASKSNKYKNYFRMGVVVL